jgi:predicted N-formylglutamate amidohydrolase
VLNGERRDADIGLLYDPARSREARIGRAWQDALRASDNGWRVRRNYPYRGVADGLIPAHRRRFPASRYIGIEIEINQARLTEPVGRARLLVDLATVLGPERLHGRGPLSGIM